MNTYTHTYVFAKKLIG